MSPGMVLRYSCGTDVAYNPINRNDEARTYQSDIKILHEILMWKFLMHDAEGKLRQRIFSVDLGHSHQKSSSRQRLPSSRIWDYIVSNVVDGS